MGPQSFRFGAALGLPLFFASLAFASDVTPAAPGEGAAEGAKTNDWESIRDEDGIQVWRRGVPNTSLVEFRGLTVIDAPLLKLAAIVRNNDRKTEWMGDCRANRAIQYRSVGEVVIYHHIGSPVFFVSDRDVVLDVKTVILPQQKTLRIEFESTTHPSAPEVDGIVRMTKLRGAWTFKQLGPSKTEVTYQVFANPGGSLPQWLVNRTSRNIPFKTISGLRTQVGKTGYEKDEALVASAFDWSAFE